MNITSIRFHNYKALANYSVSLQAVNVLVGPNNSGKSTIISALRILEYALRIAKTKKPSFVTTYEESSVLGHKLSEEHIPSSIENVHTDYGNEKSKIDFRFSNRNTLTLFFPSDGGCNLYWSTSGRIVDKPSVFQSQFPINIQVVPVLGPIEKEELIVTDETVRRTAGTPGASRHFRNYWYHNPEGFSEFKELIEKTWSGMSVKPPEISDYLSRRLVMFCSENQLDRELFWVGFGFQIWCQLLTHISRASKADLIVIDEPEVYLHPDVQRQLLSILRQISPDIILATHSTEILGEADPNEILLVDKTKQSAKRLKDVEGIQEAINSIGSIQNITLTQLARTKKILFVEGMGDYRIIRRFAKQLGLDDLATGSNLTALESGGFTSWERIRGLAWGLKETLNANISIATIYDSDFWCEAELNNIQSSLEKELSFAHIHARKEIENYLLHPSVLSRVLEKVLVEKEKRTGTPLKRDESLAEILERISSSSRDFVLSQYMSKYRKFHKKSGKDEATLDTEVMQWFNQKWNNLSARMEVVKGKEVLRTLRAVLDDKWGVTLTDFKIIDEFQPDEIPADLVNLLHTLDGYRKLA